ncbi:hypothetical protein ACFXTH_019371 [Malus domestica]
MNIPVTEIGSPEKAVKGPYDHILETFAEKYVVQPKVYGAAFQCTTMMREPDPVLSLGSVGSTATSVTAPSVMPQWMNINPSSTTSSTSSTTPSPSMKMREWEMRVLQVMMMMIWTTQSLCSRRSGEDDSLVDVGIAPNNLMVAPI